MAEERGANRRGLHAHAFLPALHIGLDLDRAKDEVGDPVEEIVLALDVPVEGHRSHPEVHGKPPEAECGEAVRVGERQSGLENPVAAKPCGVD